MESAQRSCSQCKSAVGAKHPTTNRTVKGLIENEHKDSYICFDCVVMCVSILAHGMKSTAKFSFDKSP